MHSDLGAWRIGSVQGLDPLPGLSFFSTFVLIWEERRILPSACLPGKQRNAWFYKWSHRVKGGHVYMDGWMGERDMEFIVSQFLWLRLAEKFGVCCFVCPWALEIPDITIRYCLCCLLQPQYPLVCIYVY